MKLTGTICKIETKCDHHSTETFVTLSINERSLLFNSYDKLKRADKLSIEIKKFRQKRSDNANGYMWVLLGKMAAALNTSKDELYLEMLSRYGVFTHIIVPKEAVDRFKKEWRTVRDLGEITTGGITGIQLQCFTGSSSYDTKEMSVLLDGVVSECIEMGIETETPDELERMKATWGI